MGSTHRISLGVRRENRKSGVSVCNPWMGGDVLHSPIVRQHYLLDGNQVTRFQRELSPCSGHKIYLGRNSVLKIGLTIHLDYYSGRDTLLLASMATRACNGFLNEPAQALEVVVSFSRRQPRR